MFDFVLETKDSKAVPVLSTVFWERALQKVDVYGVKICLVLAQYVDFALKFFFLYFVKMLITFNAVKHFSANIFLCEFDHY